MKIQNQYCNCTFQAYPGKRLTKIAGNELGGDAAKVAKFKSLFAKVHNGLDTNTVIDIDKNDRYVFSNASFPNISYCYERKIVQGPLSKVVVTECPKTFAYGQLLLFRNIVKVLSERNVSPEEIEKMCRERITHTDARKTFTKTINLAKWIRENMPQSRLTQLSFEVADNSVCAEKLAQNKAVLEKYRDDLPGYLAKVREILD